MSVSKRVGNSVARNLVRRRIRELFCSTPLDLLDDRDIVVSARPAAAEAPFEDLEREFRRALDRLNGGKSAVKPTKT